MPAETELFVAAVVGPAGKGIPGLAPLLVMSSAVLRSCPGKHPETCCTASESVTETTAAVSFLKPAAVAAAAEAVVAVFVAVVAAVFAVLGSVVGAGCVVAAVWVLNCQTEVVSYRTLWL